MIYKVLFILAIGVTGLAIVTNAISAEIAPIIIILLCVINSTYGGGFSNLPTVLSEHFGMEHVSQIHGFALSAWAIAGLTGNQMSALIVAKTNSYQNVLYVTLVLYIIALVVSFALVRTRKKA